MYIECLSGLNQAKLNQWKDFLKSSGLKPDLSVSKTIIIWDNDTIVATGSRKDNIVKCVAVSEDMHGEGLSAKLMTAIRQDAFSEGINHLFLYTKPKNEEIFSSLFFYPVAQTDDVLLMESKKNGIGSFIASLPVQKVSGNIGSIVMNCNPFTLGHQYLIETAARDCEHLYIFAVSEDKSEFSFDDRFEMIMRGTAHLKNVTVLPTGPYLISSASFPDYFIKNPENLEEIHCLLDIEIFTKYYVPKFSITKRYVGTEPLSYTTNCYNLALRENLPKSGVKLIEIPRLNFENSPISASRVRDIIEKGNTDILKNLLPDTSLDYLKSKKFI